MTADELANALTSGGAGWLVLSVAAILPILWAFTLVMHFARPYIIRFLGTLTLRFGGDVWWLSYVLIRDALMVITFALSMIFLMPNLYIGLGLPITAPIATVILAWALVVKLIRDSDDDPAAFRLVSVLLVVASVLYIVPQIYGLEAADQVDSLNAIANLGWIPGALSAGDGAGAVNDLAWPILNLSLLLLAVTGTWLFVRFLIRVGQPEEEPEEA
ncbi:MAG: hypothetical protein ACHQ3P_08855 [Candidatus Limnocylindrales bacterium]